MKYCNSCLLTDKHISYFWCLKYYQPGLLSQGSQSNLQQILKEPKDKNTVLLALLFNSSKEHETLKGVAKL